MAEEEMNRKLIRLYEFWKEEYGGENEQENISTFLEAIAGKGKDVLYETYKGR